MMRFPALLAAKIAKGRTARVFRPTQHGRWLEFMDTREVSQADSAPPVSHERMRDLIARPAPVVWMDGNDTTADPGIAPVVRALATSGKYVFLETGGAFLRRRIHAFQPLPRLFQTVRLATPQNDEFDLAVEGLRAARLSGFFTAVHSPVSKGSELTALERLRAFLLQLDVDAWLITSASAEPQAVSQAARARSLLPGVTWRWFSKHLERELLVRAKSAEYAAEKAQAASCQEGVKVA